MTPNERRLGARIGGLVAVQRHGGHFLAAKARAGAAWRRDPELLREHMRALAIKGAAKRSGNKEAQTD